MFSIATGSYDYDTSYMEADAVYTNKPPGVLLTVALSG
jgi:carbon-monoxide dehydrogenase large subunit